MKKILVVGDLAVDRYFKGPTKGLSPEGPYPIVFNPLQTLRLGCASNVASNVKSMFPKIKVDMMAQLGEDEIGKFAEDELSRRSICTNYIQKSKKSKTITKNRLVADGFTIARWDEEQEDNVVNKSKHIQNMADIAYNYDCIIFSDYNKGMVFDKLITTARLNKRQSCRIIIDPKKDFSHYKWVDLVKPNMKELIEYGGFSNNTDKLDEFCKVLSEKMQIKNILLTQSEKGMTLYYKDNKIEFNSRAKSVIDVTGAGDVVIATIAGFLANGETLQSACKYANIAAGISVSKFGTSTVTMKEIMEESNV